MSAKLDARQTELLLYDAYYFGEHRLAYATSKYREAFGNLFDAWSDNWCDVVVDAKTERLNVQGFRFGGKDADSDAWDIWQANNLDAYARMAHLEAIKSKEAYLIVAPPEGNEEQPRITVESPTQVIVEYVPGDRRRRLAALKKWVDEFGRIMATLYLPDAIYRYQSVTAGLWNVWQPLGVPMGPAGWEPRDGVPFREPHDLGVVPVVPLQNEPTLVRGGRSDIRRIMPLQDAVNKILNDGLVASEFGAFQQRVLLGVEVPRDPVTGREIPMDEMKAALSRLWVFEDENASIHEFHAVDLSNFYNFAEQIIHHIASQSRVPVHYFITGATGSVPNSAELKSAESGLVAQCRGKMVDFGEGWEEAMRLAFLIKGDKTRGKANDCEVIWRDPEVRTESERADALVKRRSIGVPLEQLWTEAGYSPQQIEEFKAMREREQDDETLFTLTPMPSGRVKVFDPNQPQGALDESSAGNQQPTPKPTQTGFKPNGNGATPKP